jgi:hypothetical protein
MHLVKHTVKVWRATVFSENPYGVYSDSFQGQGQECKCCVCLQSLRMPDQRETSTTSAKCIEQCLQECKCSVPAEFKDATPKGNIHNMSGSWNPFSSGPRNCIGQSLALAELRTVLAVFLGTFSFELPDGVEREKFIEEEQVWWVTLQGKNGVPLKVKPL